MHRSVKARRSNTDARIGKVYQSSDSIWQYRETEKNRDGVEMIKVFENNEMEMLNKRGKVRCPP